MLRAKFPDWLTTHVLVLSILLAGVSAVRAGEASTQDPSTGDKLEEITVTAQKREQNLQDVGTSVTAFESAGLQRLGLHNVTDIAEQVPGLQFNQYGSTVTVYNLRGVSQNDFSDHQEAPVAVYDDEAYVASTGALAGSMFDLQRVEVLRGPQGTLFGRNATGGLIHYISNKPSDESGGYFGFTRGNYGALDSEGAVNLPLSESVSARLSFATDYHEGYIENSLGHPVEDQNQVAARLQFRIKTSDNSEILVKLHGVNNDHETAGDYTGLSARPDATGRAVLTPGQPDFSGYTNPSSNPFDQSQDRRGIFNRTVWGATVHGEWRTDAFTLASVSDYLRVQKRYGEDSDGSPNFVFNFDVFYHFQQFSQELRLNGGSGALRWLTGVYFINYRSTQESPATSPAYLFGDADARFTLRDKSPAAFAQLEYDLTDRWTALAGARYTYDDKSFDYLYDCLLCPQTLHYVAPAYPAAARAFNLVTGKAEIDYKPMKDTLLYASVNRGAKGGGWSADTSGFVSPENLPYAPEKLTDYELGFKTTFWEQRARLNGSLFYYDYKDYQGFFLYGTNTVVRNVDAKDKGGELELTLVPLQRLNLQLGVSHLESFVPNIPLAAGGTASAQLPQAPRWSFNAAAHYEWPMFGGTMSAQVDGKWDSMQYLELENSQSDVQGSYAVTNARLGFRTADDRWEVSAFVRNAANKYYRIYNLDVAGLFGNVVSVYGPPRVYGATITYRWGR